MKSPPGARAAGAGDVIAGATGGLAALLFRAAGEESENEEEDEEERMPNESGKF
jgi:hypothetical protein